MRALESNILKYRAFEMVLVLFYSDVLKKFALRSLETTEYLRKTKRLPEKKKLIHTWRILVEDEVLTPSESEEIQGLIDYRNLVAHEMPKLTRDLSCLPNLCGEEIHYNYESRIKLKKWCHELPNRFLNKQYCQSLGVGWLFFSEAEKAYEKELKSLDKKINRQMIQRKNLRKTTISSAS